MAANISYLEEISTKYGSTCGLHDSKTTDVYLRTSIDMAVLLLCFTARLACRFRLIRKAKKSLRGLSVFMVWEEYLNAAAVLFALVAMVLFELSATYGIGQHLCDLGFDDNLVTFVNDTSILAAHQSPPVYFIDLLNNHNNTLNHTMVASLQEFTQGFRLDMLLLYACFACYTISITLSNLSMVCSMLAIFAFNNQFLRAYVCTLGILSISYCVVTATLGFLETNPVQASWNITTARIELYSPGALYTGTGWTKAAIDCAFIPVPLYCLARMQMRLERKITLMGLFGSQLLALALGIVRLLHLGGLFGQDITYNAVVPLIYTMDQMTASLVCLSLPTLGPIVAKIKDIFRRKIVPTPNIEPAPENDRTVNQDSVRDSNGSALVFQYADVMEDSKPQDAPDNGSANEYELKPYVGSDNRSTASFGGSAISEKEMV
ncbi:uncharacterized protein PAC_07274 [Phialocephala subalpina]|uniref:Rhodopsin domain-containing protein n=1 Tax=Phialocephala subalpina TaxID=576137 RepID=A0A1L7WX91_9HELO|nr:uncharacterized protein PAC_07274 [Phialocephala subalpina]